VTDRTVHLPVAAQESLDDVLDIGVRAEELGYDRAWFPETWGRDAATTLAALADRTEDIGIGTSIVNTYSRSPALVGQTAATLDEHPTVGSASARAERARGHRGVARRILRATAPAYTRVRRGRPAGALGRAGRLRRRPGPDPGFRLRQDAPEPAPEIDVTGMGPKAVELAGRFADGWHALMFTREGFAERLGDLRTGAELGDRDPEDVRTTFVLPCCALPDADAARNLARQHLAFYVGGMGTSTGTRSPDRGTRSRPTPSTTRGKRANTSARWAP